MKLVKSPLAFFLCVLAIEAFAETKQLIIGIINNEKYILSAEVSMNWESVPLMDEKLIFNAIENNQANTTIGRIETTIIPKNSTTFNELPIKEIKKKPKEIPWISVLAEDVGINTNGFKISLFSVGYGLKKEKYYWGFVDISGTNYLKLQLIIYNNTEEIKLVEEFKNILMTLTIVRTDV